MTAPRQIHIELEQCEGHGLCAATSPSLYDVDDDGFALKPDLDVPTELVGDAEAGMSACPMNAIRWA